MWKAGDIWLFTHPTSTTTWTVINQLLSLPKLTHCLLVLRVVVLLDCLSASSRNLPAFFFLHPDQLSSCSTDAHSGTCHTLGLLGPSHCWKPACSAQMPAASFPRFPNKLCFDLSALSSMFSLTHKHPVTVDMTALYGTHSCGLKQRGFHFCLDLYIPLRIFNSFTTVVIHPR